MLTRRSDSRCPLTVLSTELAGPALLWATSDLCTMEMIFRISLSYLSHRLLASVSIFTSAIDILVIVSSDWMGEIMSHHGNSLEVVMPTAGVKTIWSEMMKGR